MSFWQLIKDTNCFKLNQIQPTLLQASERKLLPPPRKISSPMELLMESIRKDHNLKHVSTPTRARPMSSEYRYRLVYYYYYLFINFSFALFSCLWQAIFFFFFVTFLLKKCSRFLLCLVYLKIFRICLCSVSFIWFFRGGLFFFFKELYRNLRMLNIWSSLEIVGLAGLWKKMYLRCCSWVVPQCISLFDLCFCEIRIIK